ncbi:MAG: TIGR02530 family flagellar biosynthesis protein [Bacillota bacterium]
MSQRIDLTRPVLPLSPQLPPVTKTDKAKETATAFKAVLEREIIKDNGRLKFSQHAQERLAKRQVSLSAQDLERLSQAVEQAARKGARESLILMDDLALIVSIANRTVVTAVNGTNIKESVFTNIDSAVII